MKYVFDTSALIPLFTYYYRDRFPTLWENFDAIVKAGNILLTQESFEEIGEQNKELFEWAENHEKIFSKPTVDEALVVREMFAIPHFQQIIDKREILKGGNVADPLYYC